MDVELELSGGIATLKVSLADFTSIIKSLAGQAADKGMRARLADSIREVRRSCDTLVDVFAPLFGILTEGDLTEQFGGYYAGFKSGYLKNVDQVRTHCHAVKEQMGYVLDKKSWMSHVPLLNRHLARLEVLCQRWLFSDDALSYQMERVFERLNDFYAEIAGLIGEQKQPEAFMILRGFLDQIEDDIIAVRKRLAELESVSTHLKPSGAT